MALKDAGLKAADINEVVLVGGMTRMLVELPAEPIFRYGSMTDPHVPLLSRI